METWLLSLLNGSVGAALGAVIAIVVLTRSIKVQRKLFFIGQADLYEQAVIQERKRDEQLAEDRNFAVLEARKSREITAMGDFIAAAEALRKEYAKGLPVIQERLFTMQGAAHRWRLEVTSKPLYDEIGRWPDFIAFLAMDAFRANEVFRVELKGDKELVAERLGSAFVMPSAALSSEMNNPSSPQLLLEQYDTMRRALGPELVDSVGRVTRAVGALRKFSRLYVLGFPDGGSMYLETVRALRIDIGDRSTVMPTSPTTPQRMQSDPEPPAG